MAANLLGAHMRIGHGLGYALREGKAIGCNAVQIFTSSPHQWYARPITAEIIRDFIQAKEETGITEIVCHDSYLVRLGSPDGDLAEKSQIKLTEEMLRCGALEIPYLVSHLGSTKDQEEAEALLKISEAVMQILDETPDSVLLCMETTAGGAAVNSRFEQIAILLEICGGHPRLGVCLDTCHVFVAGYDIRTPETFKNTFDEFDRLVGLDRLKAIHCNDSKKGLGSHVDRHEDIGKGCLGNETFRLLVNDERLENIPMLLETEAEHHADNLRRLESLRC